MTFDCTDIKATLSGLVDDQVDAETRHLAERHLASCAACRALVSEAEGLDDLIAMDASMLAPATLPSGFADAVLNRTVFARAYEQAGWNWTSWLGWVAAAACLTLAASIWILDRQTLPRSSTAGSEFAMNHAEGRQPSRLAAANDSGLRSWTFDGSLEPSVFRASNAEYVAVDSHFALDDATRDSIDEQLALAQPSPSAVSDMLKRSAISPADSDTLHNTAVLIDMLGDSDLSNFADVNRVREIAAYDELPERLADVRARLRPADRATVMAAESILLRIVNGPMDLNDLRMLRETAVSLRLATQIGAISAGRDASTSL